jgi:hypothetical protein
MRLYCTLRALSILLVIAVSGWPFLANGQPSELFNVKDYGAVGDGRTDDAAAFAKAVSAMIGETTAGTESALYLPAGSYLLYMVPDPDTFAFINISLVGRWGVVGDGVNTTSILWKSVNGFVISAQVDPPPTNGTFLSMSISDLTILTMPEQPGAIQVRTLVVGEKNHVAEQGGLMGACVCMCCLPCLKFPAFALAGGARHVP